MGVKGLFSYINEICPPEFSEVKSIAALIQAHKKNTSVYGRHDLVINGDSIVYHLSESMDWVSGGQFLNYVDKLDHFVSMLYESGVFPVFFFSGSPVSSCTEYRLRKFEERRKHIAHIFDRMKEGRGRDATLLDWDIVPPTMKTLTPFFLKHQHSEKCSVHIAVENVDVSMNQYALARKSRCFAVMSDDSDNIVFPSSCALLSMSDLDISKMTTRVYDRTGIAKFIGLKSTEQFPLFATLAGNEIMDRNDLLEFHAYLCAQKKKPSSKPKRLQPIAPRKILFPKLAEVVQDFPPWPKIIDHVDEIASKVLRDEKLGEIILRSVSNYAVKPYSADRGVFDCKSLTCLEKAKQLHKSCVNPPMIYSVLNGARIVCPPVLEDLSLEFYVSANILLRPLRAKIYGILLFSKPQEEQFVVEYCCYNQTNLKNIEVVFADLPTNSFPGLDKLWDQSSTENSILSARWDLFTSSISPRLNNWIFELGAVPKQMVIPLGVLFFLVDNCQLYHWEVAALIATFVLLPQCTSADIDNLLLAPCLDSRAVSLSSTVNLTIFTVTTLFAACGHPSSYYDVAALIYFDGKLFQSKYEDAKRKCLTFTREQHHVQSQFCEIFFMLFGYCYNPHK